MSGVLVVSLLMALEKGGPETYVKGGELDGIVNTTVSRILSRLKKECAWPRRGAIQS